MAGEYVVIEMGPVEGSLAEGEGGEGSGEGEGGEGGEGGGRQPYMIPIIYHLCIINSIRINIWVCNKFHMN